MRWGDLADEYLKLYPHATDAEAFRSTAENYRRRHLLAHAAVCRLSGEEGQQGVSLLLRAESAD